MKSYRLDMTEEEHRFLKVLAAKLGISVKDLLLQGAKKIDQELNSSAEEAKEE